MAQNKYQVNTRVTFTGDAHETNVHGVPRYLAGSKAIVKSYYEKDGKYYYVLQQGLTELEDVPEDDIDLDAKSKELLEKVDKKLAEDQKNKAFKDIGRRVSGSAKERRAYDKIVYGDLKEIELDELTAIKLVVKDKVYPEVNVAEEKARGVSAGAAYYKTKIRAAAPTKPAQNTKEKRAAYVNFIAKLTGDLEKCMTLQEVIDTIKGYLLWQPEEIIGYLLMPEFLQLPEEKKAETRKGFERVFRYGNSTVVRKSLEEIFSKRFVNQLFLNSDAAQEEYLLAKSYEPISESEAFIMKQVAIERLNRFIAGNEEKKILYHEADTATLQKLKNDWTFSSSSPTRRDDTLFREFALGYYQKRIDKAKAELANADTTYVAKPADWSWFEKAPEKREVSRSGELQINSGQPLSYIKRTNGLVISEEFVNAATSTDSSNNPITNTFGFASVQYGNALRDAEAKSHVRHFLGAMADMSEVLNIELSGLNRLGNLSIAFAARGKGKAMAHYEAGAKIINITNKRGDGTIAHEYGHFVDNMLYSLGKKGVLTGYASDLKEIRTGYFGKKTVSETENTKVAEAMVNLMDFIYKGKQGITGTAKYRFYPSPKLRDGETPTWSSFSLDDRSGSQKAEPLGSMEETVQKYRGMTRMFRKINRDYFSYQKDMIGDLIRHFELPYYDLDIELSTSQYYYYSSKMSSGYWVKPWELFARAWETYIADKLTEKGRTSNYLVSGYWFNMPIPTESGEITYVYPFGAEREYLFALYENVVEALKEAYSLPSFTPFTDKRQDEYLSLEETTDNEIVQAGVEVKKEDGEKTADIIREDKVVEETEVPATTTAEPIIAPTQDAMTKYTINNRKVTQWSQIPSPWKVIDKVSKIAIAYDLKDKGLIKLMHPLTSKDDLRPAMNGVYVTDKHIVATDANKLLCIPNKGVKERGIYVLAKSAYPIGKVDSNYPQYERVITQKNDLTTKVNIPKLKSYLSAMVKGQYMNQVTKMVSFGLQFEGENIQTVFSASLMTDILDAFLMLGYEDVYFGYEIKGFTTKLTVSVDEKSAKEPLKAIDTAPVGLLMPLYSENDEKGCFDIDFDTESKVYYDLNKDAICNADGSEATYDENPADTVPYLSIEQLTVIKRLLPKNSIIPILETVYVKDGVLRAGDLSGNLIIKNVPIEDGMYELINGALKNTDDSPDEYGVEYSRDNAQQLMKISSDAAFTMLSRALPFTNPKDDLRPHFQGVTINNETGVLRAYATNGHMMIRQDIPYEAADKTNFTLLEIKKQLEFLKLAGAEVEVESLGDNKYLLTSGDVSLLMYSIDKVTVNFESVIPMEAPKTLSFNKTQLTQLLNTLKGEEAKLNVALKLEKGSDKQNSLTVSLSKYDTSERESKIIRKLGTIEVEYEEGYMSPAADTSLLMPVLSGDENDFTFNIKYLQDFLSVQSNDISLHYTSNTRSFWSNLVPLQMMEKREKQVAKVQPKPIDIPAPKTEPEPVKDVVAPTKQDIEATIKGLQVLADLGDKDAAAAIKGLKLLI